VAILSAALIAATYWLLLKLLFRLRVNTLVAIALVTIGALASSLHWLARPHLFTILLTVPWYAILLRYRRGEVGPRTLLALPLLMLLWVNLHGGFLIGFILLGVFLVVDGWTSFAGDAAARQRIKPLAVSAILSIAAGLANPAGWHIFPHVLSWFGQRFLIDYTIEYQSPNFHTLGPLLFLGLLLLILVLVARSRQPLAWVDVTLLVVWTYFALYSVRNIPIFVVVALPILGQLASAWLTSAALPRGLREHLERVSQNTAAVEHLSKPIWPTLIIAAALVIATSSPAAINAAFDPQVFPVTAAQYVKSHGIEGHMFNYFTWGGYLLYALYPQQRVFIDGQTDFYGETLTREYNQVTILADDWAAILQKYAVDWIIYPTQAPLSQFLGERADWTLIFRDDTASIFVRRSPEEPRP
jgi:hypothetical protein